MSPNLNESQATRQVLLIGLTFLTAGLGALVILREPTPLLILGIMFTLSLFIAPGPQNVIHTSREK